MSTTTSISLGNVDRLTILYSYPNSSSSPDKSTLAATIEHWFAQTLQRDGLASAGAKASVRIKDSDYFLDLTGPDTVAASLKAYAIRLPQFLANGWAAWSNVVPTLKSSGKWDPCPDAPPYNPWRFFLPHGMAMLNQKAVLFFHYPPIRLLETNRDYLDDPVPVRCEELLAANGVTALSAGNSASGDILLFNTVMDATPIGAEDDQGSKKPCYPNPPDAKPHEPVSCTKCAYDPVFTLVPIQYFHDYQKAQVSLLLNPSPTKPGYTVPVVVYGAHPLETFNALYGTSIKNYQPIVVANIIPGMKTPVLASSHPYVFYGIAQNFTDIGSGITPPANVPAATKQMQLDLAVAGWLKAMSDDPAQDPAAAWKTLQSHWSNNAQTPTVGALVQHQGSLWYYNKPSLDFKFKVSLQPAS